MPTLQPIHLDLTLQTLPRIMTRGEHVLILLTDERGRFVLGEKNIYPAGIVRMVGGGTDGEVAEVAAQRELNEELGIQLPLDQLKPLFTLVAHVTAPQQPAPLTFTTHVFAATINSQTIKADSDLDGLAFLSEDEFKELIERYQHLSPEVDPHHGHAWADYGQLYGRVHQLALEKYHQLATT